jgi:hypothetical protein
LAVLAVPQWGRTVEGGELALLILHLDFFSAKMHRDFVWPLEPPGTGKNDLLETKKALLKKPRGGVRRS